MLEINNVSKIFGSTAALKNINFKVEEGEFVFLTGPSGAGKTTILRLILRDLFPDTGEIILDGEDITKLPNKKIHKLRQNMGTVFQDFKVLPERTVEENISVALAVCGIDPREWDERVNRVLELVSLQTKKTVFPSQLSGGELQRVSLARALVVNPMLILADEPTGNLDWETADGIMALFDQINKEGKTILMATHHQGILEKYKKRTIEIRGGEMVKDTGEKGKGKSINS